MADFRSIISSLLPVVLAGPVAAGEGGIRVLLAEPAADRWMYPANATPGTRPQASTFSALPDGGDVDDRFGQFVFRFDTAAAGVPAGLGPANYEISRVTVSAMIGQDGLFRYQPTSDAETGRPMELHGTGFRHGFTPESFLETSPYSTGGTRNAYAMGFDEAGAPRDVSNQVTLGFPSLSWANGLIDGLEPGDPVPADTPVTFPLDLSRPGVVDYLREGLDRGVLWFTLSSLHPAVQQGGEFVSYHTRDSIVHELFGDAAPALELEYSVPPGGLALDRDPTTGEITLGWTGVPGFVDTVQASDELSEPSWEDIETFAPDAPGRVEWHGPSATTRRFFRISRSVLP